MTSLLIVSPAYAVDDAGLPELPAADAAPARRSSVAAETLSVPALQVQNDSDTAGASVLAFSKCNLSVT